MTFFVRGSLRRRNRLEAFVRNRLAAFDRKPVRAGGQPRLGPLDRGELLAEVVRPSRVKLVLVEVGGLTRRVLFVLQLTRVLMAEPGQRTLDPCALGGEELPCPLRIHGATLSDFAPLSREMYPRV